MFILKHYFTDNKDLLSEQKKLTYNYKLYDFSFLSDNGVFSKEKIDFGSRFLLETFLNQNNKINNALDVGCGYGFMGIVISKIMGASVTLIDVNKRALHLTKMNLKNNLVDGIVLESNSYENVDGKYDLIITNPPIRAGKKVLEDILIGAKDFLTSDGQLWFVMRKDHGAKSMSRNLEKLYNLSIIDKSKGFFVFCCKNR